MLGLVAELGLTLSALLMVPHSASVEYIFWRVWRAWQMFMSVTSSMKTSENPQDLEPSSLVRMKGWKEGGKLSRSVWVQNRSPWGRHSRARLEQEEGQSYHSVSCVPATAAAQHDCLCLVIALSLPLFSCLEMV